MILLIQAWIRSDCWSPSEKKLRGRETQRKRKRSVWPALPPPTICGRRRGAIARHFARPSERVSVQTPLLPLHACLPGFTSTITCLQNRLLPPGRRRSVSARILRKELKGGGGRRQAQNAGIDRELSFTPTVGVEVSYGGPEELSANQ